MSLFQEEINTFDIAEREKKWNTIGGVNTNFKST